MNKLTIIWQNIVKGFCYIGCKLRMHDSITLFYTDSLIYYECQNCYKIYFSSTVRGGLFMLNKDNIIVYNRIKIRNTRRLLFEKTNKNVNIEQSLLYNK